MDVVLVDFDGGDAQHARSLLRRIRCALGIAMIGQHDELNTCAPPLPPLRRACPTHRIVSYEDASRPRRSDWPAANREVEAWRAMGEAATAQKEKRRPARPPPKSKGLTTDD